METDFNMQGVDSSNIDSIGYDEETKTLRVQFLNGGIYDYAGVSQAQFDALLSSDSKGQYLNMAIKSQFPYTRVN
jgi:hypothetical protein